MLTKLLCVVALAALSVAGASAGPTFPTINRK